VNRKKTVFILALATLSIITASSFAAAAFWINSNGNSGQRVTVNYYLSPLQVTRDTVESCKFTLTTTLTDDGVAMAGKIVTFTLYNSTSSAWEPIAYATTDANGVATTVWYATSNGIYNFNAKYYVI